jgi:hypothetical protein
MMKARMRHKNKAGIPSIPSSFDVYQSLNQPSDPLKLVYLLNYIILRLEFRHDDEKYLARATHFDNEVSLIALIC